MPITYSALCVCVCVRTCVRVCPSMCMHLPVHSGCLCVYMILIACDVEHYPIDVPAVDTHRPKPKVYVCFTTQLF